MFQKQKSPPPSLVNNDSRCKKINRLTMDLSFGLTILFVSLAKRLQNVKQQSVDDTTLLKSFR